MQLFAIIQEVFQVSVAAYVGIVQYIPGDDVISEKNTQSSFKQRSKIAIILRNLNDNEISSHNLYWPSIFSRKSITVTRYKKIVYCNAVVNVADEQVIEYL